METGFEAHKTASRASQRVRLGLLQNPVDAVALRGMEDAPVAEPEGDVRRVVACTVGVVDT